MECTLLCHCLALPKVSYVLRTCPPDLIQNALQLFDNTKRDALSDLAGCSLTDWAWVKATLPTSFRGLGLCSASLHASAAYISSVEQAKPVVNKILSHTPLLPPALSSTIVALADAAATPEWLSIEDIHIPLHQHSVPCHR